MAQAKVYYATGRRKTSAARVFLKPGSGKVTVNKKEAEVYFTTPSTRNCVVNPFTCTDTLNQFDAYVTVSGGGITGQAEAVRHGLSRALTIFNEELRGTLKKAGFLRRDPRMVERKKYGLHKARRRPQFSKR